MYKPKQKRFVNASRLHWPSRVDALPHQRLRYKAVSLPQLLSGPSKKIQELFRGMQAHNRRRSKNTAAETTRRQKIVGIVTSLIDPLEEITMTSSYILVDPLDPPCKVLVVEL